MVFCVLQAGAVQLCKRIRSVPTSDTTEACPLVFAGLPASCATFGLPERSRGGDLPTITVRNAGRNACGLDPQRPTVFQTEVLPRLGQRGY